MISKLTVFCSLCIARPISHGSITNRSTWVPMSTRVDLKRWLVWIHVDEKPLKLTNYKLISSTHTSILTRPLLTMTLRKLLNCLWRFFFSKNRVLCSFLVGYTHICRSSFLRYRNHNEQAEVSCKCTLFQWNNTIGRLDSYAIASK